MKAPPVIPSETELPRVIELAAHGDDLAARQDAIRQLAALGEAVTAPALDALLDAFESDFSVQDPIDEALALDPPGWQAIPATFSWIWTDAASALLKLGQPAILALQKRQGTMGAARRLTLTRRMADLGPVAAPALQTALHDEDPRVRAEARGVLVGWFPRLEGAQAIAQLRTLVEAMEADASVGDGRAVVSAMTEWLRHGWPAQPVVKAWDAGDDFPAWLRSRVAQAPTSPAVGWVLVALCAALGPERGALLLREALTRSKRDLGALRIAISVHRQTTAAAVEGDQALLAWVASLARKVVAWHHVFDGHTQEAELDLALVFVAAGAPGVGEGMIVRLKEAHLWSHTIESMAAVARARPELVEALTRLMIARQLDAKPGEPGPPGALTALARHAPERVIAVLLDDWGRLWSSSNAFRFVEVLGSLGPRAVAARPTLAALAALVADGGVKQNVGWLREALVKALAAIDGPPGG